MLRARPGTQLPPGTVPLPVNLPIAGAVGDARAAQVVGQDVVYFAALVAVFAQGDAARVAQESGADYPGAPLEPSYWLGL